MDRLRQDLRAALRGFRRTPAFFATAVIILGLGIGMSVAMFTVFRAVLVRRLPVVEQDRIAVMWTYRDPTVEATVGAKKLATIRKQSRTMLDIAAVAHFPAIALPMIDGNRAITLNRALVSGNYFDVLGARPALGRLLRPSDDDVGDYQLSGANSSKVMVISYAAWQSKFGGDSSVIGHHLIEPYARWDYTIVGVAPPGLSYPVGAEYWAPIWGGWTGGISSYAVARLARDATITGARDEYFQMSKALSPDAHFRGANAATFTDTVLGNITPVLTVLTAAVALLLLIACLNVGNLLLLRASARAREIAVRRALGAGYGDVVRQLVVESGVLATAGGVFGFMLAEALLRLLVRFAPPQLPRLENVRLSGAPLLSALAVTAVAVLLFGVLPALFSARANLATPLRFDSRSGNESRHRRAVRQTLVASQVALAMVMVGGAALLARSLERLERQDLGYVSDHLSILSFSYNAQHYDSLPQLFSIGDQLLRRLQSMPGITAATPLLIPPLIGPNSWQFRFDREGQSDIDSASNPSVPAEAAGKDFFRVFGIPLTRGHGFTGDEGEHTALVAVVSESFARRMWPDEDPIGKRIRFSPPATGIIGTSDWRTVVGVAPDTHLRSLRATYPSVYFPWRQAFWQTFFAIRGTAALPSLTPAIRSAAHDLDPQFDLWHAQTMDELLAEPLAQPRLSTLLMSSFGIVALMLAALGLFGVMSSIVREQTRELGIRIALGAMPSDVLRAVLGRAFLLTLAGTAVGLVVALMTSRVFASLLFGVSPTDPVSLAGASVLLLAVGLFAAYLPARRATRIDPVQALRAD